MQSLRNPVIHVLDSCAPSRRVLEEHFLSLWSLLGIKITNKHAQAFGKHSDPWHWTPVIVMMSEG